MGKYNGPSCRLCRRAGEKLFLKGDRCFTPRCAVERRHNPPGDVSTRRSRPTDYAVHLREKQKARQMYGVMEGQFRKYMTAAFNTPGVSGLNLLRALERRLDNVVFLLNFADSRKQARQFVNHGHFTVNGVNISFLEHNRIKAVFNCSIDKFFCNFYTSIVVNTYFPDYKYHKKL